MTQKLTTRDKVVPVTLVIVTMDTHLASATERAVASLRHQLPGLIVKVHAASEYAASETALQACLADIAKANILLVTMLFMEEHFNPVVSALESRRQDCDALVCILSATSVSRLTKMGKFDMAKPASGPMAWLKKLRGERPASGAPSAGAAQMRMLRRLPRILRFIPGTAQDVRIYFLAMQYWLGGSQTNIASLICCLIDRYASGTRAELRGALSVEPPKEYPDVGLYHPRARGRIVDSIADLPRATAGSANPPKVGRTEKAASRGRVGLILLRSYLLAGNTAHYDGVIDAMEALGLDVIPVFASGLDARPAIERYFGATAAPSVANASIDVLVSLTGFSLVGGPAYNDSRAAEEVLAQLDVPYIAAQPVEFQTIAEWGESDRGLMPVENTIMVAIPELDGATSPLVFGGRAGKRGTACKGCHRGCTFEQTQNTQDMASCVDRAQMLASRVAKLVDLRCSKRSDRKIAIVIFNFPPNAGNIGTAAYLSVFESLFESLRGFKQQGYQIDLPASVDELRHRILDGNSHQYGTDANVHAKVSAEWYVQRERWLGEIEAQWGPAPGKQLTDGRSIYVLGAAFGNALVAIQPSMGYEGDPMRLLFERGFSPTHAFAAFYRYLREDYAADAVLHFGTHGALEFMPGKQSGLSGKCWPDRLIADLPNFYLYASNNPSEGAIAKRRAAATLVSYLTPPVAQAGLYRGLLDLRASINRWRSLAPKDPERAKLSTLVQAQAAELQLVEATPAWDGSADAAISHLQAQVLELEYTLIPHGLHVVGKPLSQAQRVEMLLSMEPDLGRGDAEAIADGKPVSGFEALASVNEMLAKDFEVPALLHALDGRYVRPAPGGDLLRTREVLPTGRNLHGFDPFRIPSRFARDEGARLAELLIGHHQASGARMPESIALVLWGTDNLKTEGVPIAQALALLGAEARFDSYGRLAGATLIPLEQLGRPRVDVMITLSGIFRDLLPLQVRLLAEAAWLAACADEPESQNFIRKHALAYQREVGCDLETAALRVFGNADGAYGSNVNNLVDNGRWSDEDELAETYSKRKGFAYGRDGKPKRQGAILQSVLADVDIAYQNLDSVELGVTTIDTYFDSLGGVARAVSRAKGGETPPVYIGDQTRSSGVVRSLSEQVALETRTRMLNPKWYEGMLAHGYEGVRQIEVHLTNTMGWSATTGQVAPWVYEELTNTFVLDESMRRRLSALNPTASAKLANRLIEAQERKYWTPSPEVLEALQRAGEELEDQLEGVGTETNIEPSTTAQATGAVNAEKLATEAPPKAQSGARIRVAA
jgi:magnesium chelatase subunit H